MLSIWLVLTIFLNFDPAEARDCNCGKVPRLAEHFAYLNTVDVENRSPPGQNSLTCLTVPFMATMRAVGTNKTLCSGLILSQKMVIFPFNCLVVQAKEVPWGKYEIQVGSHSKSGGSFHQVRSLQTATNLAVGHSSYYLGFTLSNPIEFDCVNTLPICLNAPSANASEFVVVGHSLKDAAMRDYKDSGLYTVGTMKSFPCPPNHKHSLCLYSDKIGLMDADEGGPALVLENGIFYVVGMAAGGHIMEYENQFGRKGVVGYDNMAAKLNKLLKQFDGAFEKIDTGKLKCTLTSHELPARFEELKAYTENRKFLHAYGMQQIEKKYPEVFTDDGEGFVLCNLTKTRIAKTPTSIENYVKGKKFMIALHKAKEEVQKALEAEDGDEDADEDEMEVDETVVEGEDSDEEDAPVEDEEEDIEEEEEVPPPPPKAQKRKAPPQKKTPSGRAKHKKLQ